MNKIILLITIFFSLSAQAQYFNQTDAFLKANSVWTFGDTFGLKFSDGVPQPIATALIGNKEGCASVADSAGNLLFYMGNTGIIYNRNHQPMLNGTGIYPGFSEGSSIQGALIIPVIDTPWKYYTFTNMEVGAYGNPPPYLAYSVVDMTLDNGLGAVEPGRKNVALDTTDELGEGMIAVPGDNCDIWLLTYATSSANGDFDPTATNGVKAWHITKAGIASNFVLSPQPFNGALGGFAVSPDRKKIAVSFLGIDPSMAAGTILWRFDPSTGRAFDSIYLKRFDLPNYILGVTSACFSPDNSKLYLNASKFTLGSFIEQLDISTYNLASIAASVARIDTGISESAHSDLKLYNDTIYTISGEYFPSGFFDIFWGAHLSKIVNPNASGPACGFKYQDITIPQSQFEEVTSLPNAVVYPVEQEAIIDRVTTAKCKNKSSVLSARDGFYGYEWDNGEISRTRTIDAPGVYWVKYYKSPYTNFRCEVYRDTFEVGLVEFDPIINVNLFDLSTTEPYNSYQWFLNGVLIPGATNKVYPVTENGDYTVVVTNEEGCIDTSAVYEINNWTSISAIQGMAQSVHIFPNPASNIVHVKSSKPVHACLYSIDGRSLISVTDATEISVSALPDGLYLLRILDEEGRLIKAEKIRKQQP